MIFELYVILAEGDNGEGIVQGKNASDGCAFPLITSNREAADKMRGHAQQLVNYFNRPAKLVRFTARLDLETFSPEIEAGPSVPEVH